MTEYHPTSTAKPDNEKFSPAELVKGLVATGVFGVLAVKGYGVAADYLTHPGQEHPQRTVATQLTKNQRAELDLEAGWSAHRLLTSDTGTDSLSNVGISNVTFDIEGGKLRLAGHETIRTVGSRSNTKPYRQIDYSLVFGSAPKGGVTSLKQLDNYITGKHPHVETVAVSDDGFMFGDDYRASVNVTGNQAGGASAVLTYPDNNGYSTHNAPGAFYDLPPDEQAGFITLGTHMVDGWTAVHDVPRPGDHIAA